VACAIQGIDGCVGPVYQSALQENERHEISGSGIQGIGNESDSAMTEKLCALDLPETQPPGGYAQAPESDSVAPVLSDATRKVKSQSMHTHPPHRMELHEASSCICMMRYAHVGSTKGTHLHGCVPLWGVAYGLSSASSCSACSGV
jgi:hypothetical protein